VRERLGPKVLYLFLYALILIGINSNAILILFNLYSLSKCACVISGLYWT
jgi:hypothetical protein